MDKFTFVGNGDVNAIDDLYERYKNDPESVDIQWARFFEGVDFAKTDFTSENEDGGIPKNFFGRIEEIYMMNSYKLI